METVAAPERTQERFQVAAGFLAALVGAAAIADGLRHVVVSSDTTGIVAAVDSALAHVRAGQWQHWGGAWPLLQAIPAFALRAVGVSSAHVIDGLVGLNVASFAVICWVSWRGLVRQSAAGAILLVAVLFSGTLLWYLHSSLGEPLAAAVTLGAAAASWHDRRHVRAAALLFLAGLSKDAAVPFLLLLCLGASAGTERWSDASWRWRRVGWLLAAGALSFLVTCAYNYARFGSVLDVPYLAAYRYVPWLSQQAGFFAAVWLSPNGGLVPFWPSFGAFLILAAVAAGRATIAGPVWAARLWRAAPALGLAAVLLGMTIELSKWFAPLGWIAWGSRLMLPWVPAAAYVLVAAYHGEITSLLRRIADPPWRAWLVGVVVAVASLPQYVAMVWSQLFIVMLTPDVTCPRVPVIENGAAYYYSCTNHLLWTKESMLLVAFEPGGHLLQLAIGGACAGALLWLLTQLRAAAFRSALA